MAGGIALTLAIVGCVVALAALAALVFVIRRAGALSARPPAAPPRPAIEDTTAQAGALAATGRAAR